MFDSLTVTYFNLIQPSLTRGLTLFRNKRTSISYTQYFIVPELLTPCC